MRSVGTCQHGRNGTIPGERKCTKRGTWTIFKKNWSFEFCFTHAQKVLKRAPVEWYARPSGFHRGWMREVSTLREVVGKDSGRI